MAEQEQFVQTANVFRADFQHPRRCASVSAEHWERLDTQVQRSAIMFRYLDRFGYFHIVVWDALIVHRTLIAALNRIFYTHTYNSNIFASRTKNHCTGRNGIGRHVYDALAGAGLQSDTATTSKRGASVHIQARRHGTESSATAAVAVTPRTRHRE